MAETSAKLAETSAKLAETSAKILDSEPKLLKKIMKCKYCQQQFKHSSSMARHIKYSCTKNKDEDIKELVRLMNIQLQNKEKERKLELKNKIE